MPTIKRYIPLLLAGLMSACLDIPELDTSPPATPPQPDAGAVDTPDSGAPPTDLSVTITAPTGTFYTSGSVAISVDVRGGTPEVVRLFKDTEELATISSPYTYTWNTAAEPEGSYTLTARATESGRTFSSAPVTVIVDRTNLQVSSRSPAPGATNVAYSTPIQVVFSKPVKATTVSDTTVSFAVAGVLAEKTLSLSSDGRTLTVAPKVKPPLPATFTIGLSSGITDSAGNALLVPSTPWSFQLPHWYSFGGPLEAVGGNTPLKDTAMTLDSQDNPVVAWSEVTTEGRASIFVYRWDGNAFTPIGSALNGTSSGSAYKPALVLDGSGNPIVAWQESDGFNENIYVRRWTGTTWQSVGAGAISAVNDTGSNPVATPARNPSLAVHGNEIYVAWDEVNADGFSSIYVRKSVDGGAFIGAGHGGGLVNAVSKLTSGSKPSLVLDSNGNPIVAFQEETLEQYSPTNIYVMRLQPDGSWAYAVPPFYGDDTSGYVSGGLSASPGSDTWARDCSLTIDAQNNLYLAWAEESYIDGPRDIQVFRSTGTQSWERVGSSLSAYGGYTYANQARIQSAPSGRLFVTWKEFDGNSETGYMHLFASYWNNNSWNSLTTSDGINQAQDTSLQPMLAIDSAERPVVAWYESRHSYEGAPGVHVYVRRYNE